MVAVQPPSPGPTPWGTAATWPYHQCCHVKARNSLHSTINKERAHPDKQFHSLTADRRFQNSVTTVSGLALSSILLLAVCPDRSNFDMTSFAIFILISDTNRFWDVHLPSFYCNACASCVRHHAIYSATHPQYKQHCMQSVGSTFLPFPASMKSVFYDTLHTTTSIAILTALINY